MILRSMRSGFMSAFFLGLLVLGGVSLVFSDWNGMFRGGVGSTDVAKVDGTPIKIAEFDSKVRQILQQQQIDPATAYKIGLIDNILNNQVDGLLAKKDAEKLGIRIEDRLVANQIKDMISTIKKDGETDKAALKRFLELQGISEKQLISSLRDNMTSKILNATIASSSYVPDILVESISDYNRLSRNVDFMFLPTDDISISQQPDNSELQSYYATISTKHMIPETRDVTVAILDSTNIKKEPVTDDSVRKAYEDNKNSFLIPESAEVEQSLFPVESSAKKVVELMLTGKSMDEAVNLATAPLSKNYQGKTSFTKDAIPEEIGTPLFAAKAGDIIGPIKTAIGFHVIRLIAMKEAHTAPFDDVKEKVRKELEAEKSGNAVFEVTSAIEDRLANGEKYEDIKSDYPIEVVTLKSLQETSKNEKNRPWSDKDFSKILAKVFSVKPDSASELSDIENNKLFSVRVDSVIPSAPIPLDSIKTDVVKQWLTEQKSRQNLEKAQKLVDDLNTSQSKPASLKFETIPNLSRTNGHDIPKDALERLMGVDPGKFILVISKDKNGIYVARVNSTFLQKDDGKPANDLRDRLEKDASNSNYMMYMESLRKKYAFKLNDDLLKQIYGRAEKAE